MYLEFTHEDDEGVETVYLLPASNEVCQRCDGCGVHDPEAFDQGFSSEDFAEDPDFAEDYFAGTYDVPCEVCHGRNVVLVPRRENLTPEEERVLALYDERRRKEAQYRAERRREQRMGY